MSVATEDDEGSWPDCTACGRSLDHDVPCSCPVCCPPPPTPGPVRDDRWWQVYCSILNPAVRPWLKTAGTDTLRDVGALSELLDRAVKLADAAAEAARRAVGKGTGK